MDVIRKYKILQLKDIRSVDYAFMDYKYALQCGLKLDDYKTVYEGEINVNENVNETLEDLFRIFNVERPNDFRGHSLSVSDIVEIDGKQYYCDYLGWKAL